MFKNIFCILLFLLLSGCSENKEFHPNGNTSQPTEKYISSKNQDFIAMLDLKNENSKIKFEVPKNNYKSGKCIDILLENISNDSITFTSDFGLRIFTYDKNNWMEVPNTAKYIPPGERGMPPHDSSIPAVLLIPFCPDLPHETFPVEIRVLVTGTIDGNTDPKTNQASAFIDITIEK